MAWIHKGIAAPLLIGVSLAGSVLTGCGDGQGELEVVLPPSIPPTIRDIGFAPDVRRGEFTTLSQSVDIPGGVSPGEEAFALEWIPPEGDSITTQFTADQANCRVGALECISSFQPRVPADLPVVGVTYEVIYTVRDQQGLSTDFLRLVFVGN